MNSRKLKLESELASMWWKVKWNEVTIISGSERSLDTSRQINQMQSKSDESAHINDNHNKIKSKLLTVNTDANGKGINKEIPLFMPRKGMYKVCIILVNRNNLMCLTFR